jgi:hypothetical protein
MKDHINGKTTTNGKTLENQREAREILRNGSKMIELNLSSESKLVMSYPAYYVFKGVKFKNIGKSNGMK